MDGKMLHKKAPWIWCFFAILVICVFFCPCSVPEAWAEDLGGCPGHLPNTTVLETADQGCGDDVEKEPSEEKLSDWVSGEQNVFDDEAAGQASNQESEFTSGRDSDGAPESFDEEEKQDETEFDPDYAGAPDLADADSNKTLGAEDLICVKGQLTDQEEIAESLVLADGVYAIASNSNEALWFDVAAGGVANGTEVVLWGADYSAKQAFRFQRQSDGYYVIEMVHSGKVLAATSFVAQNGTQVVEWVNNGTDNMLWELVAVSGGHYLIVCKANGLVLDYANLSADPSVPIVLWERTGSSKQWFTLIDSDLPYRSEYSIAAGVYSIVSVLNDDYAASVLGFDEANGTDAVVWGNNKTFNQKYYVSYESGFYVLSLIAGPVLSSTNMGRVNGSNVVQWSDNATGNQRWVLIGNDRDGYEIVSAVNNLRLDFAADLLANGTSLVLWQGTGSAKQRFRFVPVATASSGYYAVVAADYRGLAVSIWNASLEAGTVACLAPYAGGLQQKYQVIPTDDGTCLIRSLQSGLYLLPQETGCALAQGVAQQNASSWNISAVGRGRFVLTAIDSHGNTIYMGMSNGASIASTILAVDDAQYFKIVPIPILETGLYYINNASTDALKVTLAYGSSALGLNVAMRNANWLSWQKFYIESLGFDGCQIRSLYSDRVLAAEGLWQSNGAPVVQWANNGTSNMLWTVVPTFDGHVSFAVQSSGLYLDYASDSAWSGVQMVVWENTGAAKQKFSLEQATHECVLRDWISAINSASSGFACFNTDYRMSSGVYDQLLSAINGFRSTGASVGFMMMDLVTGQGLSYEADLTLFGASTVKAPYVASVSKYYGTLSPYGGLAYDAIVWSNNDAYTNLRSIYGSTPLHEFCQQAATGYDWSSVWPYASARELALLWANTYDYFTSDAAGSSYTASLYTHSYKSAINGALGNWATVYSKPGWMDAGLWSGSIYNDAGVVMMGDRPYLISIVSSGAHWNPSQMESLVWALNAVHSEMVGW